MKRKMMLLMVMLLVFAGCKDTEESFLVEQDQSNENNLFLRTEESDIDYSFYESKIWVVQNWEAGAYEYSSFRITEVNENDIVGEFTTGGAIAKPNFYFYSFNTPTYIGQMSGTVNANVASLKFSDEEGNSGSIAITFDEGTILADIHYTTQGNNYKNGVSDGCFVFKPYNLKNIENLEVITEYSPYIELNSNKSVRFISGEVNSAYKIHPVAYITDDKDNILYEFVAPFKVGTKITDITIQDFNNDSIPDIGLVTSFIEDEEIEPIEWVFLQNEDGVFYSNQLVEE